MGNDSSKTEFISIHNNNRRNNNNNRRNNNNSTNHQIRQNLTAGTLKLEPIDRRAHYRSQDKRFAKLVREERTRYVSPMLIPSQDDRISGRLPKSEIPPTSRNNDLVVDGTTTTTTTANTTTTSVTAPPSPARPNNWPDPWIAFFGQIISDCSIF